MSNVRFWLFEHGYTDDSGLADYIFALAKRTDHVLSDDEVHECCREYTERTKREIRE
jgi:hypothetical protein